MSRAVQSQADVGNLSIAGLSAFSSILATLSADNVVPMALIQMEKLGAALPTSGEYADRAKGLLQRCSDVRLDHLAMVIGWRKNDSASLMAESAGGQAIALVSMCLVNLFWHNDTGTILSRLCSRLLTGSMNISSVAQLADAASLLSGKLNMLGFGNMLAREVTKIHQVYEALGKPAPCDLLEPLDLESVIELLESVSRALREDQKICRISGGRGMGHILGLLQALFRRNITVTVEGTIIQDIEDSNIFCEIMQRDRSEPTQIHFETCIPTSKPIQLPITILQSGYIDPGPYFNWTGCVADRLQMTFLNYGFNCDQAILDACCDLLMPITTALSISATTLVKSDERRTFHPQRRAEEEEASKQRISQPMPLLALLGPLPRARMYKICEEILRSKPTTSQVDLSTAFSSLVSTVTSQLQGMNCTCSDAYGFSERCWVPDAVQPGSERSWVAENRGSMARMVFYQTGQDCALRQVWEAIGYALNCALWCFFINAGPNTVICPSRRASLNDIIKAIDTENHIIEVSKIAKSVMQLAKAETESESPSPIAMSSASCTIYPTILKTLGVPSHQSVTYTIIEGIFVFEGRHYSRLHAEKSHNPGTRTIVSETGRSILQKYLRPSLDETHISGPLLTIRENVNDLEVLCSFKYSGHNIKVHLKQVIEGYTGMRWTDTCHHPMTDDMPLDSSKFNLTSIASPAATKGRYGVVMARWNPVAQFLCCEDGYQAILVKDCCLNCAVGSIYPWGRIVFIVA